MATFTASEKTKIRRYLGYQVSPENTAKIQAACTRVENIGAEEVQLIKDLLREIGTIDQQIRSDRPFASTTFRSGTGGTTQQSPTIRITYMKDEARRLIRELAESMSLPWIRDIYGQSAGTGRLRRA